MTFEQSILIECNPSDVFSTLTKVSEWPEWDPETESASLDGDFVLGSSGKIKPKGSPETKITITELTPDQSFTVECGLPLCKMHFVHLINNKGGNSAPQTEFVNQLIFSGLLGPVFARLFGKSINNTMPGSLQGLKNHIEGKGEGKG